MVQGVNKTPGDLSERQKRVWFICGLQTREAQLPVQIETALRSKGVKAEF